MSEMFIGLRLCNECGGGISGNEMHRCPPNPERDAALKKLVQKHLDERSFPIPHMDTKREDAVQERVDKARRVVAFVGRPGATTDHTIVHLADALQAAESSRAEWQRTADAFALDVMEYLAEIQTLRARHTWLSENLHVIRKQGDIFAYYVRPWITYRGYDSLDQLIDTELPTSSPREEETT